MRDGTEGKDHGNSKRKAERPYFRDIKGKQSKNVEKKL